MQRFLNHYKLEYNILSKEQNMEKWINEFRDYLFDCPTEKEAEYTYPDPIMEEFGRLLIQKSD